jgi:ADP-ribose pyrophosphatase
VSKTLLEIPAGNIEAGEEAIQCARRELEEETGYTAQKIEDLGGFYSSPGFCDEFLHLYLATELQPSGTAIDADEIEKVVSVPLTDIPGLISSGEICDAKSIAGLLRVLLEKFET